jgi:RNA polymerase sigma-70 factor (ECF subfamily)
MKNNNLDSSSHHNIQQWVTQYADDLYRWALHKTNDRETSEDLVQETFLSAYKSIDKFQQKSQPKTWLFSIINNKITDFHRKKFRETIVNQSSLQSTPNDVDVLDNFFDKDGSWKPEAVASSWMDNEEHLLDNMEFKGILQNCMQALPEKWFYAIHFKYMEEKDGQEICQELGITSSNYWKMLQRAKLQLKMCLEKNWSKS